MEDVTAEAFACSAFGIGAFGIGAFGSGAFGSGAFGFGAIATIDSSGTAEAASEPKTPDREAPSYVALLDGAIGGDRRSWDELLVQLNPLVRSVVGRYRLDSESAADVVQTVWIKLFENVASIRDPNRLPGWLSTTSRNESLNRLAQLRRFDPAWPIEEQADTGQTLDQRLMDAEARNDVRLALDALPAEAKTLLALTFHRPRLSYAEIAARIGRPIGSIGPTRARYLRLLRAELQLLGRDSCN